MQPGDVKESFADIDHTTELLFWKPSVDIKNGIPQFIEWYNKYYKMNI